MSLLLLLNDWDDEVPVPTVASTSDRARFTYDVPRFDRPWGRPVPGVPARVHVEPREPARV